VCKVTDQLFETKIRYVTIDCNFVSLCVMQNDEIEIQNVFGKELATHITN